MSEGYTGRHHLGDDETAAEDGAPGFVGRDHVMEMSTRNPKAPVELAQFEFLIGSWRIEGRLKLADGTGQEFGGAWVGRFILDGYAIADEYRMTDAAGAVVVLGMNFRTYDAARQMWNIRWLNGLTGTWADLVSEELGGVRFDGRSVTYAFREPTGTHALTRATYTSLSPDHFTWRGEQSEDGEIWREFLMVESYADGER
jgi:hypothetical protein